MEHWQSSLLEDLTSYFAPNKDVLGLLLFGSCSKQGSNCDEQKLADVDQWPGVPFFSGAKSLFSRSNVVDEIASRESFPHNLWLRTDDQFLELVRDFRFKSMLAVYKVVRNDLLVALHLSQDLIRDCCVLGMMLRGSTLRV
jgi:hypothetical protein